MKSLKVFIIPFLFLLISTTDYHGMLFDINGEYLTGDFTFNESKLPLDLNPFTSNQLRPKKFTPDMLIKKINITLKIEYENIIHLKITDSNNPDRWEVPEELLDKQYRFNLHKNTKSKPSTDSFYNLVFTNDTDFFSFELRDENGKNFYTFSKEMFLFSDRYINFESILSTNDIYGFGERGHELKLNEGVYTIWPNDTGGIKEDDGKGGLNGYSHQPIGLHRTNIENVWMGFIFLNSNNQDVVIKYNNDGTTSLQHRTIGGVIDYYIIVGKSPIEVVQNIYKIIGPPFDPPYWSLGHHQCRYGYNNIETLNSTYINYTENEIPVDVMWVDIDSYDNYQIFSINETTFKGLGKFVKNIKDKYYTRFIPIIDIGIGNTTGDKYLNVARDLNCFIKSNYTKKELFLEVWPGATAFPDYLNPNTTILWEYGLKEYWDKVSFDGIWYDMNEIACLSRELPCVGEIADKCDKKDNFYYYEDLPYLPGYNEKIGRTNMAAGTINENAILYGPDERKYAIYNTKPILSYMQGKMTYNFLRKKLNFRPFIITRSATMGSGKHNGHWLGDNYSNYKSMRNSVDGIFQFMIYGITMTGDDICGFFDDGNSTLCNRWYNLGAFYPFCRNHNFNLSPDHYPWSFDEITLNNIRSAINSRYRILRYLYSHLFAAHLNEKVGLFNPVFFYYPNDPESYKNMNDKVMIGEAFILFPVFTDDTSNITRTFPPGRWHYFPSGKVLLNEGDDRNISLSGRLDIIHLYMKSGVIIPYQDTFKKYIPTSQKLREEPLNLLINPDENNKAKGLIIIDNDEVNTIENNEFMRFDLDYDNGKLNVKMTKGEKFTYFFTDNEIALIEIIGGKKYTSCKITVNIPGKDSITKSMIYEAENDKFTADFERSIKIDEIDNVEFNFNN